MLGKEEWNNINILILDETVYIPDSKVMVTNDRTYKIADLWTMCTMYHSSNSLSLPSSTSPFISPHSLIS